MNISLSATTTLGFLGAGQLARMSAAVAFRLGIQTAVFSGSYETSGLSGLSGGMDPLEQMTSLRFPGLFDDEQALIHFAKQCDLLTLENEFLDGRLLARVEKNSETPMLPSPETFQQLETKHLEKETFRKAGIPVTPYLKINRMNDLDRFASEHGHPFLLKSSKGGYDGYGNVTVTSPGQHRSAFEKLGGNKGHELIAEAFIPFEKELAVQVARNHTGVAVYPCCETIQKDHICKTVIAPAQIEKKASDEACRMAVAAVEAIDGTGLFAFEFFLTSEGTLLLNESAPRPHNSGHYSIEGCITSQFENHIRAVLGLPLGATDMRKPVAVMENLLGRRRGPAVMKSTGELWNVKDAHLHIYGKESSRIGRKMGHLTVLGEDPETTRGLAAELAATITI